MITDGKLPPSNSKLKKALTGINGFDEISDGGLPKNRNTIICGNTGCGKTVMSMEFLVNGARKYNESGVFMSFEETSKELIANMDSLNFNLDSLVRKRKIYIEYLDINRGQNMDGGKYDLEGLFVRLKNAIDRVGAKRIVIDSLDALLHGLDPRVLRSEITRLFKWLKERNITALITAEIDNSIIKESGLELHIADCVIALDNRVINQTTTRRMRIVKMRGSVHGNNEYPFIIDGNGISVLPLIAELKGHSLSSNTISSGIDELDKMLGGKGFFQGSSILVSGSAGTGKTSLAVSMITAACKRKIRCLYCAFEESTAQITRNMGSIGLNLEPYRKSGVLKFYCSRPTLQNLELHIIAIQKIIKEFNPEIIVLDPVTNLMSEGINTEIRHMLAHFADFLKGKNITTMFTAAITLESIVSNPSDEGISAMTDTWLLVRDIEKNSERNRGIYVLKSRGMSHSTQVREFVIADQGINILPTYLSPEGVLTGSAKLEHSLKQKSQDILQESATLNRKYELELKRKITEEKIALLMTSMEAEIEALNLTKSAYNLEKEIYTKNKSDIVALRNKIKRPMKDKKNNKI